MSQTTNSSSSFASPAKQSRLDEKLQPKESSSSTPNVPSENIRAQIKPPPAWRVTMDMNEKGFVYDSVVRRLSEILAKASLAVKGWAPEQRDELAMAGANWAEIASLQMQTLDFFVEPCSSSDGGPDWNEWIQDAVREAGEYDPQALVHQRHSQISPPESTSTVNAKFVSWFFLENYAYRRLLGAIGYFSVPDSIKSFRDPFAKDKRDALAAAESSFVSQLPPGLHDAEAFDRLLKLSLWGNRADLSLSAGVVDSQAIKAGAGLLLVDHSDKAWALLQVAKRKRPHSTSARIVVVLDNCGAELLSDMVLAEFLISRGFDVEFIAKSYPVFVSDATKFDVNAHLDWLAKRGLCTGLCNAPARQFLVTSHSFFTTPLFFDKAPADLVASLSTAYLVITKGDANYRRLIGDATWPPTTPFSTAILVPHSLSAILAVRTCKSPSTVGLTEDLVARATSMNQKWGVDGSSGVIQLHNSEV